MTGFVITKFAGEAPRVTPKLLSDNNASLAHTTKLTSGDLDAWNGPSLVQELRPGHDAVADPYRAVHKVDTQWVAWTDSEVAENETVKLFPTPVVQDTFSRYYFNENRTLKMAPKAELLSLPRVSYLLGVPKPVTAATIAPPTPPSESQSYAFSFVYIDGAAVLESTLSTAGTDTGHPLAEAAWTVRMQVAPVQADGVPNYPTHRRVYRLDGATPKLIAQVSLSTTTYTDQNEPFGATYAGGTLSGYVPTDPPTVVGGANPVDEVPLFYVYTLVDEFSQESAPSPAPATIPLGLPPETGTIWTVTVPAISQTAGYPTLSKVRLYRSVGDDAGLQLVEERALVLATPTVFEDQLSDGEIPGDALLTDGWEAAPSDVDAFTYMGNGVFAAVAGGTLYFCQPYLPFAWPTQYRRAISRSAVAMEVINNRLVLLTDGDPIIFDGVDPSFLSEARLDTNQPCVGSGSVVSTGAAVMYASPDGYVSAGLGGTQILTRSLYAKHDWAALTPDESSFATRYDDGVILRTPSLTIMLAPSEPFAVLTRLELPETTVLYTDPDNGDVYFVKRDGKLYRWNGDANTLLTYAWESRTFVTSMPVNFGVAQIDSDAGALVPDNIVAVPGGLGIDEGGIDGAPPAEVTTDKILKFSLYAWRNGAWYTVVSEKVVSSTEPFRLPSGFKSDAWKFRLEGTARVHAVYIAETPRELKAMGA